MDDFMESFEEVPTVTPAEDFDPVQDSETLRSAMKGFGTDEQKIIDVIAHRTSEQRQQLLIQYQTMFGRILLDDLKSELGGTFEDVVVGLMTPLHVYLAKELESALEGAGTTESTLIEILCTRDVADIESIKEAYKEISGEELIEKISSDTTGNFGNLLISMCSAGREENTCDIEKAQEIAKELHDAGEGKRGTEEDVFNKILAMYSRPFLICVFAEYEKEFGHSFEQALKKELSGDLLDGMLAIYLSTQNRPGYFAKKLHEAMKGGGTNDKLLMRVILSRCEIDLGNIKEEYQLEHEKCLSDVVKSETSGEYKKILLDIIG